MKQTFNDRGWIVKITTCLLVFSTIVRYAYSQDKYVNGIVKELHADKDHKSKPLSYVTVKLLSSGQERDSKVSKEGGYFSFTSLKSNAKYEVKASFKDYVVLDESPLKHPVVSSEGSTIGVYILMGNKDVLAKLENTYFKKVKARLTKTFQQEVDRLKKQLGEMNKLYNSSLAELKSRFEEDLETAKRYAANFSKAEFNDEKDPLYLAFQAYLNGRLDSCEYYYDNNSFLQKQTNNHLKQNRQLVDAWLINAEAKLLRKDTSAAHDCYKQALVLTNDENKYQVLNGYCTFLVRTKQYALAYEQLNNKLNYLKSKGAPFDQLLRMHYEFVEMFASLYSEVHMSDLLPRKESKEYSNLLKPKKIEPHLRFIADNASDVLETHNYYNIGLVLNTIEFINEYVSLSKKERIEILTSMQNVVEVIDEVSFHSLSISVPKRADVYDLIAEYYEDIDQSEKAYLFYKKAIEYTKQHLIACTDKNDLAWTVAGLYGQYSGLMLAYGRLDIDVSEIRAYLNKEYDLVDNLKEKVNVIKLRKCLNDCIGALDESLTKRVHLFGMIQREITVENVSSLIK